MIRWSKRAFADFQSIHNFIAADNPEAARQQCVFIYESIDQLNKFPRSGKPDKKTADYLLPIPRTPYVLTYRLQGKIVLLRRIRHGAQRQQ